MKKLNKILIAVLTVMLVFGGSVDFSQATEIMDLYSTRFFYDAEVDSNTFSRICYSNAYYSSITSAELYINKINKADGSSSSYKRVKSKIVVGGYNSDVKTTKIYTSYQFKVPKQYQYYSQALLLSMGNDPSLDCRIYGYITTQD